MGLAQSVALTGLLLAVLASAASVCACYVAWRTVKKARLTPSMRAELDEIHDGFAKHSALLKRINSRTVMAERRALADDSDDSDSTAQRRNESVEDWKKRMRARLIVPGKPAKHG